MDAQLPEIDPNFEPQSRVRSNTWPCRPHEMAVETQCSPASDESTAENAIKHDSLGLNKKTTSRRNAWGNLSYADLITKAIQSSAEQRLTLSQIYDWMVQNVPYFKDKGDNTSSAGWKNSIRHNLSLHNRFMRIQNEGTGKSSWWILNPDAKPGKTPRRRAGSMETKSYEKRRGRVKKKVDALRAALENNNSPGSASDDYLLDSPHHYQLSPEFRQRTSSNASSCGRLSPIQAGIEPDLHDNQVPPMSPIAWVRGEDSAGDYDQMVGQYDQLVDTLVDSMKLGDKAVLLNSGSQGIPMDQNDIEMLTDGGLSCSSSQMMGGGGGATEGLSTMTTVSVSQYTSPSANYEESPYRSLAPPPAYPSEGLQHSPQHHNGSYSDLNLSQQQQQQNRTLQDIFSDSPVLENLIRQANASSIGGQLSINTQQHLTSPTRSPLTVKQVSPSYSPRFQTQSKQLSPQLAARHSPHSPHHLQASPQPQSNAQGQRSILQQVLEAPNESLLRAALTQTQKPPAYSVTHAAGSQRQNSSPYNNISGNATSNQRQTHSPYNNISSNATINQRQTHSPFNNISGNDIRFTLNSLPSATLSSGVANGNNLNNNNSLSPSGLLHQQQQQVTISQAIQNTSLSPSLQAQLMLSQMRSSQGHNMAPQVSQQLSLQQLHQTPGLTSMVNHTSGLTDLETSEFLDDLPLNCDVEQVLQHELTLEGNLDFNFDPVTSSSGDTHMVR